MVGKQPINGAFTVNRIIPVLQVSQDKLQEAVRALRQQNAVIDAYVDKRGRLRAAYDASRLNMRDIETNARMQRQQIEPAENAGYVCCVDTAQTGYGWRDGFQFGIGDHQLQEVAARETVRGRKERTWSG